MMKEALDSCSLGELINSMTNISSATKISHRLVHLTVDEQYLKGSVQFASEWVKEQLIGKYLQFRSREVQDFLIGSGGEPAIADFRGKLWERRAHEALYGGGTFDCRDLQDAKQFQCELQPCSNKVGLWDIEDVRTQLASGIYGFGKNQSFPAVDAVVQPDKLFQITVSDDHRIDVRGLASAVQAMQASQSQVQLYFAVPPDKFTAFTKQTLKRVRGDVEAASVARSVKQYVLKIEL